MVILDVIMQDWTRKGGWRMIRGKKAIFPGEPGYGEPVYDKPANEYYDRGFKNSEKAKNLNLTLNTGC
jgi:hypothetical protein